MEFRTRSKSCVLNDLVAKLDRLRDNHPDRGHLSANSVCQYFDIKDRIEALDGVGVCVATCPFFGAMVDGLMAGEALADAAISAGLIRH
jgi:hypothetical protein